MATIKDVARECGVSVATVSKALNDYADIGEETRKKVRETADRLGYFPNSNAIALKTRRSYNIGILFSDDANSGLTHDFFAAVLEGLKSEAEQHGYNISFTSDVSFGKKVGYLEQCRRLGVEGVVIACVDFFAPNVQQLVLSDVPVVTIDHVFDNRIAVTSDNIKGMHDLTEYVYQKGHRKIAYIHGMDSSVTRARLSSFHHTLSTHGLEVPDAYLRECAYRDVEGAARCTGELLDLPDPPTCILYPDDLTCIGAINVMNARRLRIGEDISIAGYDGIPLSRYLQPQLTTIWQDAGRIGQTAAAKLISLIENPRITFIERVVIEGKLQEGGTIAQI